MMASRLMWGIERTTLGYENNMKVSVTKAHVHCCVLLQ